ncbi:hypothetical protein J5N97_025829 [Dioscorea zingiberensis]|uniref:Cation/H+ exchanger transmembrane domain-containing protein n=1 Tax=Dioscorea zingiberensis TaxID=325984 RepID=A0A9D5C1A9_9LILI|nr:hypothetical protein J5N97_025829 [Dioscorea zingiberensis]
MGSCVVVRGSAVFLVLLACVLLVEVGLAVDVERGNGTDSFADMIDRALQKEFPESEQNETESGNFNSSVAENQAVLETVARVTSKKNDTKEDKSFQLHDVFNNENRAEDMPTLIDRKDNVFIISNPKSKYPMLQLDQRLISDLVVVIVSAACGGIAFACAGQPVITGYLLAGSVIGPGGFSFVSEMVQVETVAQFGVIFLLLHWDWSFLQQSYVGVNLQKGVFVGAFLSMSSTAVSFEVFDGEKLYQFSSWTSYSRHTDSSGSLVIIIVFWIVLLACYLPCFQFWVALLGVFQGVISMAKSLIMLCSFLAILSILSRTCVPWFLKLMISLSSQTNELYQLAAVAFCLLVAWSDNSLQSGSLCLLWI